MKESGAIVHHHPVRVYYEDTDTAGVVYYANYLKFAERARTEWLRSFGIAQRAMAKDTGVAFAVRRLSVDYRAPAHLDDLLDVASRVEEVRPASLSLVQDIHGAQGLCASLAVQLACVNASGRPTRLPPDIAARFAEAGRAVWPSGPAKGRPGLRQGHGVTS